MYCRARGLLKIFNSLPDSLVCKCQKSTDAKLQLFIHPFVQQSLRELTRCNLRKVFSERNFQAPLKSPVYKLMTTEQLKHKENLISRKAHELLQMPPVLEPRKEIEEILSNDPGLDGFDEHHAKYVFTDISEDTEDHSRTIVVREPNGLLRKAFWDERKRMNQTYFPMNGRNFETPEMFEEKHLNNVLDREDYLFILDRACIQFEPDEPLYVEVTRKTYNRINEKFHFERLHSTRHFGSMAFYLILQKDIDNMLIDNIRSRRIQDAYTLVELYQFVHDDCKSAAVKNDTFEENLVNYIKMDSKKQADLELEFRTYLANKDKEKGGESEDPVVEKAVEQ